MLPIIIFIFIVFLFYKYIFSDLFNIDYQDDYMDYYYNDYTISNNIRSNYDIKDYRSDSYRQKATINRLRRTIKLLQHKSKNHDNISNKLSEHTQDVVIPGNQ